MLSILLSEIIRNVEFYVVCAIEKCALVRIEIGSNWRQSLRDNVALSLAMIACSSPDFLRSEYCKAEVAQVLAEHKPVYFSFFYGLPDDREALRRL